MLCAGGHEANSLLFISGCFNSCGYLLLYNLPSKNGVYLFYFLSPVGRTDPPLCWANSALNQPGRACKLIQGAGYVVNRSWNFNRANIHIISGDRSAVWLLHLVHAYRHGLNDLNCWPIINWSLPVSEINHTGTFSVAKEMNGLRLGMLWLFY